MPDWHGETGGTGSGNCPRWQPFCCSNYDLMLSLLWLLLQLMTWHRPQSNENVVNEWGNEWVNEWLSEWLHEWQLWSQAGLGKWPKMAKRQRRATANGPKGAPTKGCRWRESERDGEGRGSERGETGKNAASWLHDSAAFRPKFRHGERSILYSGNGNTFLVSPPKRGVALNCALAWLMEVT